MQPAHRVRYWVDGNGRISQVLVELLDDHNDVVAYTWEDVELSHRQFVDEVADRILRYLVSRHGHQLPLFPPERR